MNKDEAASLFEHIKRNRTKLDACPRHSFECAMTPDEFRAAFGQRLVCTRCNGAMLLTEIGQYIRGYEAAGGNADDIWPDFNTPKG